MRLFAGLSLLSVFFVSDLNAQFTAGNLAVFRADNAAANNTGFSIIEINPVTANQAIPVNTFTINSSSGTDALRTSGSASSTGYLANSNDGSLLCFTGHNSTATGSNANTILARAVGTLNATGIFSLATTYSGTNGNQTRCATSLNNTDWFIADQGGVYSNGTTAANPAGNFRSIRAFGGAIYIFQASASSAPVSTLSAASGGTLTGLPGLPNGTSSYQDFYLLSSGSNGAALDMLYMLTAASATSGSILKYSLVAGTWVANGTYTTNFGGFGMAAAKSGTGAALYVTTGTGATAANNVLKIMDDAGYNTAMSVTTANSTLFSAAAGTTLKGIAMAPVAVASPSVVPTPASVDFGTVMSGSSSATQSISFTAAHLTPPAGTLTVTSSSADFELFDGVNWGNTVGLTYSGNGSVVDNLLVRFSPHSAGALSGSLSIAGGGLFSPVAVAVTGTGNNNLSFTFSPANAPALNPPDVSGTVNDPADPAATTGISVLVKESNADILQNDYSIAAASSNPAVVPVANITIGKADGTAIIKINPTGTGYSDISVTLNKGTDSRSLVIHYAASTAPSSAANWPTGFADASAAIALDDNYMVVGNDENNFLYVYTRNASGLPLQIFDFNNNNNHDNILGLTDGSPGNWKELDIEAASPSPVTAGKSYWLGSMSNSSSFNNKPNRDRIIAINTSGTGASTSFSNAGYFAGLRQQLINWGNTNGYNLTASAADGKDPKTIDGFNLEGMAFGPDNTTLYLGFRAPLVPTGNRTKALIAPIQDFENWFNNGSPAGNAVIGAPIELDLGGRGIRDIIRLSNNNYSIIAGSYDGTSRPAIFRWSGIATDAPLPLTSFDLTGLNAEAALAVNENGQVSPGTIQIICDNGDNVYYGDGIAAKDLSQDNYKKFSSQLVQSATESLLPVHFEYFNAQRNAEDVRLSWQTGNTDETAFFDIQRSDNGYNFKSVAKMSAITGQTIYEFTDPEARVEKLYYRINAVDRSAKSFLSSVRIIAAVGTVEQAVKLYPNPVRNGLFTISINRPGTKQISIYNNAGILYKQVAFNGATKDISTEGWARGYYFIRITTNDGRITTEKLVIE